MKAESVINKIAGETMLCMQHVPMVGKLKVPTKKEAENGDYAVLTVPQSFVDSIYEAMDVEGKEPSPNKAHISVFTDEEMKRIGEVDEKGQEFAYQIRSVESCKPDGWDDMELVYFVTVHSPDLEALREKYGLSKLIANDHDFHITIAVVPKAKKSKAAMIERISAVVRQKSS